jgi:hypothetical protein
MKLNTVTVLVNPLGTYLQGYQQNANLDSYLFATVKKRPEREQRHLVAEV